MKAKDETNYLERFPLLLSIAIAIIFLLVLRGGILIYLIKPAPSDYDVILTSDVLGIIFALIVMFLLKKLYIIRERKYGIIRGIFVGGFLFCVSALGMLSVLSTVLGRKLLPISNIVVFIAAMVAVGIAEEFIFRGIILNLFIDKFGRTKKGVLGAIIISSIMFGCAHMNNVFSGISLKGAFIQAMGTIMLGALLAAVYLRTRNIWVVAILHAFMDFSSLIGAGLFGVSSFTSQVNQYSYVKLISVAIYLIPVVVLLRKEKMKEILES
ncbi:CPBP family intramembrane glutamic endopeptidase [Clostridium acetobutylicum]|uniref:Conserved membrane protein n=1 Tax=Clostridium acetobutylicum (strain ATCC 824 / DSM 792 / JCM 1419 / IAM 19013 / LMG 5710 / NBRC 13948 / NRRL B-527 / VKM B-1787 / 2291 / W) TaxID=272562 RepID=Q97TP3_CLOAB|nr:CPBP family intramembrane glutamic endopeptidase [Clostridium acetobutylicum]AAK76801.1 Conserved membrane protein [Clostridium acetobutylicum ATCC 824]